MTVSRQYHKIHLKGLFGARFENHPNHIEGEFWNISDQQKNPRIHPNFDFVLKYQIEAEK